MLRTLLLHFNIRDLEDFLQNIFELWAVIKARMTG